MKTFIICNPAAGEGLARNRWNKFKTQLEENGIAFEFRVTDRPNHATEIANDLIKNGYRRIGVFGGDGTVNEVLQGVMAGDQMPPGDLQLILLPAGSSCDFKKKFPNRHSLIDTIRAKKAHAIDIFKVECYDFDGLPIKRFIINNSSIGIISLANEKYNNVHGLSKLLKQISVDAAAITSGIGALMEFDELKCNYTIDQEKYEDQRLSNITVFKTPHFGGGMYYGVETQQDDGLLTVALIGSVSRMKLFSMIPALYTGTVFNREAAWHRQCRLFEISTEQPAIVETDGQNIGQTPAKYTILKRAIQVVI